MDAKTLIEDLRLSAQNCDIGDMMATLDLLEIELDRDFSYLAGGIKTQLASGNAPLALMWTTRLRELIEKRIGWKSKRTKAIKMTGAIEYFLEEGITEQPLKIIGQLESILGLTGDIPICGRHVKTCSVCGYKFPKSASDATYECPDCSRPRPFCDSSARYRGWCKTHRPKKWAGSRGIIRSGTAAPWFQEIDHPFIRMFAESMEEPDYLMAKEDIVLLRTRMRFLIQRWAEQGGAIDFKNLWWRLENLEEGFDQRLDEGDTDRAINAARAYMGLVTKARNDELLWQEAMQVEGLLTQTRGYETKRILAASSTFTVEQVMGAFTRLAGAVGEVVDRVVSDERDKRRLLEQLTVTFEALANNEPLSLYAEEPEN